MRRLVPWLATGILAAGAAAAGVAGGLGVPGQSPAAWATQLLATTRAAGTAQVEMTTVTASPSPLLVSSQTRSGLVDFRTGSSALRLSTGPETSASRTEQIVVGRRRYLVMSTGGTSSHTFSTMLPQPAAGPLGTGSAVGSLGALDQPDRVWQVRRLGSSRVDGTATTRFQVEGTGCATGTPAPPSLMVWVDGQGRLVQVLDRIRAPVNLRGPNLPARLRSFPKSWLSTRITTTTVVRFTHFGRPVHISAPGSPAAPTLPPAAKPLLPTPSATVAPTPTGVSVVIGTAIACGR